MEQQELIMFWVQSSDSDFNAMVSLYSKNIIIGHYLLVIQLLKSY